MLSRWINRNAAAVIVASLVLLMLAFGITVSQGRALTMPHEPGTAWYYDAEVDEYFIARADALPPRRSPFDRSHEAVRAYFFTCGSCDEEERFLGYYVKYRSDAWHRLLESRHYADREGEVARWGRLYSLDGRTWVVADSPEGREIEHAVIARCESGELRPCIPESKRWSRATAAR